jgi:hypothetical protein
MDAIERILNDIPKDGKGFDDIDLFWQVTGNTFSCTQLWTF